MKIFSCIISMMILFVLIASSAHLTKTHKEFQFQVSEKIALEEERKNAFEKKTKKIAFKIQKVNPAILDELALKIGRVFLEKAEKHNLKVEKLLTIAAVESRFDHRAINKAGDYGIMQVNWYWWGRRYCKKPSELLNIETNVEIACLILKKNKKMGFHKVRYYHSLDHSRALLYENKMKKFSKSFEGVLRADI